MKKIVALLSVSLLFTGCASSDNADQVNDKQGKIASALKVDNKNKDDKKDTNSEKKDKGKKEEKSKSSDSKTKNRNSIDETEIQKTESKSNNSVSAEKEEQTKPNTNNSDGNQPSNPNKPTETPPPVIDTPAPPTNQQAMADQVFAQINAYRAQNGKEPFIYSAELRNRCDSHSLAMAQREALWHSGNGAECITNYEDPFSAWINSPPHQKLLLSNNTEAAVGIYYYNGYYYSVFQTRW